MTVNFSLNYFIVHNVDLKKWCERYDLKPFAKKCKNCGRELSVSIPFIAKNRRGLFSKVCDCGNKNIPFTYIDFNFPSSEVKDEK